MATQEQNDRAYGMAEAWANDPDRLYAMLSGRMSPDELKEICGYLAAAFSALTDFKVSNERTVREASTAISMIHGIVVERMLLPTAEMLVFNEQNATWSNWPDRIAA